MINVFLSILFEYYLLIYPNAISIGAFKLTFGTFSLTDFS